MIDKAKKVGIGLAISLATESIKSGFRRLLRRKTQERVPCLVVDKFSYLFKEFGEFTSRGYGHNIMSIIETVCSPFANSGEIAKELVRLRERHELTVKKEYAYAVEALECFKKNEEKEWFDKASKHLYEMLNHYVGFAKPLNELLLVHNKPETLKSALRTIDDYYTPMKERFNYLISEYVQLATRSKSVYYPSHDKLDMLLPDIPSKENLATFQEIMSRKTVTQL